MPYIPPQIKESADERGVISATQNAHVLHHCPAQLPKTRDKPRETTVCLMQAYFCCARCMDDACSILFVCRIAPPRHSVLARGISAPTTRLCAWQFHSAPRLSARSDAPRKAIAGHESNKDERAANRLPIVPVNGDVFKLQILQTNPIGPAGPAHRELASLAIA